MELIKSFYVKFHGKKYKCFKIKITKKDNIMRIGQLTRVLSQYDELISLDSPIKQKELMH